MFMKQLKAISNNQKLYIILLLLLTGVFFYLRSINRELFCDEIMYGYKLNATKYGEYWTSPKTALDGEIKTIGDVISSQYNHYFYGNGRAISHTIEQLFTGVIGVNAFYLFNTVLFLATLILFVRKYMQRDRYLSWLLAVIAFLYLFPYPSKLWYSINLAPNYLFPLSMTLLLFYQYDKLKYKNNKASKIVLFTAPIAGLLAGWSNEAFSVPVSGAFLICYILGFKKNSHRTLLSLIPLWIGTALVAFSPGVIARFMKSSGKDGSKLIDVIARAGDNLLQLKIFWILIIAVIIFAIWNRHSLIEVLKKNLVIVFSIIIGLLFGLVANTAVHSFTAIEFLSLILTCMLVAPYIAKIKYWKQVAVVFTILFCGHQSMIVKAEKTQVEMQRTLISEFTSNKDGIVLYDNSYISPLVKPFVTTWDQEGRKLLHSKPFKFKYGERNIITLSKEDYNAFSTFNEMSANRRKIDGDGCFYYYGGTLCLTSAHNIKKNQKFVLRIQEGDEPSKYREVDAKLNFESTRWGYFYFVDYPKEGKLLGIYLKK